MIGAKELDKLVKKYETKDFILSDPVQFPHRFGDKNDMEIAAFISSLLAYGKREVFIKKLDAIFDIMNNQPHEFIMDYSEKNKVLDGISYRFASEADIKQVFLILHKLYQSGSSLNDLFIHGHKQYKNSKNIQTMLQVVSDYFYSNVTGPVTAGFYHLIPNPKNNSPLKRFNMFLRWMLRTGPVDLGLWDFMDKSDLLIPLDTHVSKVSRKLNLIQRSTNDFKTVLLLTDELKKMDRHDPVKYDFALFGFGVNS